MATDWYRPLARAEACVELPRFGCSALGGQVDAHTILYVDAVAEEHTYVQPQYLNYTTSLAYCTSDLPDLGLEG